MNLSFFLLVMTAALFGLSFLFNLFSFLGWKVGSNRLAFALLRVGFLVSTFYFAAEGMEKGFFLPVANFSQALTFFAWSLGFVYLIFLVRIQTDSFGIILTPILFLLLALASIAYIQHLGESPAESPLLRNPYFMVHILCAFFAYASFTLSFAAGLLYLIQHHELKSKHAGTFYHKLPALEELEKLIYQPLMWGAPLLVIAVSIGMVWSKSAFGEYWFFDPKTIATLIIGTVYLAIIYLHYGAAVLRGKQGAVLSLLAFGFLIVCFVGTRFIEGSHNYLR